ncbi:MAG: hypothetical protein R3185_07635 [Candidatus Thermoplasmatota archaeon]|nr:hypothetical protein [Candidatus Thermoplasmatota archaeon]
MEILTEYLEQDWFYDGLTGEELEWAIVEDLTGAELAIEIPVPPIHAAPAPAPGFTFVEPAQGRKLLPGEGEWDLAP